MQTFKKLIKSERLALTATSMLDWVRRMFGKLGCVSRQVAGCVALLLHRMNPQFS